MLFTYLLSDDSDLIVVDVDVNNGLQYCLWNICTVRSKQYYKPSMAGNGKRTTYKNGETWNMTNTMALNSCFNGLKVSITWPELSWVFWETNLQLLVGPSLWISAWSIMIYLFFIVELWFSPLCSTNTGILYLELLEMANKNSFEKSW